MSLPKVTLCVFVRAPNLGRVKSRLSSSIGEAAALAAYIELVDHLLLQLDSKLPHLHRDIDVQLWLADAPKNAAASQQLERWQQKVGQPLHQQHGSGLGERMDHALTSCVGDGKVVGDGSDLAVVPDRRYGLLIGSDCPTIDRTYLDNAIAALEAGADVVLGPAEDGGYGLVGLAQPQPALFSGVTWGTDKVLEQTLYKAKQASIEVRLLDTLWDVDYVVDWERFCKTVRPKN